MKIFIILLALSATVYASETQEWELLEKSPRLELYSGTKSVNGVFPYKARMITSHTIPEILAVFLDNKRKTQWVPRLRVSWAVDDPKVLGHRIEYGEVLVPWPFNNRDVLIKIETQVIDSINNVRLLAYSTQNERIIKKSNVRAIVHPSDLLMSYDPTTKETILETISFTDPGGNIPKWLVNLFQKGEAKKLSEQLRKQLKKKLYSEKELNEIKKGLRKILKKRG